MAVKKKDVAAPRARKPSTSRAGKVPAAAAVAAAVAEEVPVAVVQVEPAVDLVTAASDPEAVRSLAYRLWQERGGSSFDNWLEAERRLLPPGA